MKIIIPQNIYAAFIAMSLPDELKKNIVVKPSALICNELQNDASAIGLIPSLDIFKHRELYISSKLGLSFDGVLSNTYIYFQPDQLGFTNLFLRGDVSTNEIILSKILFSERYSQDVNIVLDTAEFDLDNNNYIVVGNENLDYNPIDKGMSFADQVASLIDYPYVNFIWASKSEGNLLELQQSLPELDKKIEDNIEKYLSKIDIQDNLYDSIVAELNSVYFEMTENEKEALVELIKLPFYSGIFDEIIELKFV
ncbi:MAG: hypothetical protein QY331_04670 [Melioribacteraceae bacterium]|nr:MAG: hypothetical protein QY331_04670 [Melioribacteraceae bacterium]